MDGWQRRKTSLSSSSPHYMSYRPILDKNIRKLTPFCDRINLMYLLNTLKYNDGELTMLNSKPW